MLEFAAAYQYGGIMDDYQKYIQSGNDSPDTNSNSGCSLGCSTIGWIIVIIVFLIFWYSNGGT